MAEGRGRRRRIKALIFSQTFPIDSAGSASDPGKKKQTVTDPQLGRKYDVDAVHLKQFFTELRSSSAVCQMKTSNISFEKIKREIEKEVALSDDYDCFIFVFLSFCDGRNKLQFNSETLSEASAPTQVLLDFVDQIQPSHGKRAIRDIPKIYLIQTDDLSLAEPKVSFKAGTFGNGEEVKPLTSNNSLIAVSTIPQKISQYTISFLVKAFAEEFASNNGREDAGKVMEKVKVKVRRMVEESNHERKEDMPEVRISDRLDEEVFI